MIRLALRVPRAKAELVLAELLELAPNGFEETEDGDFVEYAVYGAPGELPAMPDLQLVFGDALVDVSTTEVGDDWETAWKAFHRPVLVGERIYVRPPWCDPSADAGVIDLVIDPAQAFGTGAHHTTRICLELLLELDPGGSFADLGCGSGVLAVAAAKLGWGPVAGYDYDPLCIEATHTNAAANGVAVPAQRWELREDQTPFARTIAANIIGPLLIKLAATLTVAPENLILSGLLREEADEVAAAFEPLGLRESRRVASAEWAALTLTTIRG